MDLDLETMIKQRALNSSSLKVWLAFAGTTRRRGWDLSSCCERGFAGHTQHVLLLNNEILQNIEHVPSFINYMYFDSFWQRSAIFFTARLRCDLQIHDLLKQWRLVILSHPLTGFDGRLWRTRSWRGIARSSKLRNMFHHFWCVSQLSWVVLDVNKSDIANACQCMPMQLHKDMKLGGQNRCLDSSSPFFPLGLPLGNTRMLSRSYWEGPWDVHSEGTARRRRTRRRWGGCWALASCCENWITGHPRPVLLQSLRLSDLSGILYFIELHCYSVVVHLQYPLSRPLQ